MPSRGFELRNASVLPTALLTPHLTDGTGSPDCRGRWAYPLIQASAAGSSVVGVEGRL